MTIPPGSPNTQNQEPDPPSPKDGASKDWLKISFAIVGGLLGAGILYLVSSQPRGEGIKLLPPPTPAPIAVHVTGAVLQPDVYSLPAGSRVSDAIEAAGGLSEDANPDILNLATILEDGQRIFVPTVPPDPPPTQPRGALPTPPDSNQLISINTGTQLELETLPGIGPVTAQKIIAYRETNGLFDAIEEIQDVPGIGPKTFESIKDLITVDFY